MELQGQNEKGGLSKMGVDSDSRASVNATFQHPQEFISSKNGKSFSWVSEFTTTDTDQEIFYLENTSEVESIHIDGISFGSDTNTKFTVFYVNSGTAAGTSITAVSLCLGSASSASYTAYGNAEVTGSLSGDTFEIQRVLANKTKNYCTGGGIRLAKGRALAISCSTITTACEIILKGRFKPNEQL